MASNTLPENIRHEKAAVTDPGTSSLWPLIRKLLAPVGSLRLTVVLFGMAIFIVFAGTVAQIDRDIWDVVNNYFRTLVAWIDLQIFFPRSVEVSGGFYFPGGWLIGWAMVINLLAAHLLHFKIRASGSQRAGGVLVIAAGVALTYLVIVGDTDQSGAQRTFFIEWPSMRILWQLVKGSAASLVLLAGCALVFGKRAGIVLLHAGIGLMMFNELFVGTYAVEGQMQIAEGETVNFVQDARSLELAVIDSSHPDHDNVVVIPGSILRHDPSKVIRHDDLPFDVQLVEYLQNTAIRRAEPGEKNLATAGAGLTWIVDKIRPTSGTDSGGSDLSAAYVTFTRKGRSESLGTYLLGLVFSFQDLPEKIIVDGKPYEVVLRYKRNYKPYSMHLLDVRFDKYMGTNTARNYSSDLHLVDPTRNVDHKVKIWMNNPLRFAGETFYQSTFNVDSSRGVEMTGLQVVTNLGWMIPYVACMIVATGMLGHFGTSLIRFLDRRLTATPPGQQVPKSKHESDDPSPAARNQDKHRRLPSGPAGSTSRFDPQGANNPSGFAARFFPLLVVSILGLWLVGKAVPPRNPDAEMDLYRFSKLPLVYEGRVKPFDTLARNSLVILSEKQTFDEGSDTKQPAIKWLLDTVTGSGKSAAHQVFRIVDLELRDSLGLKRRKGARYSFEEISPKLEELDKQVQLARKTDDAQRSRYQRSVLELARKLELYLMLQRSFDAPSAQPGDLREQVQALVTAPERIAELSRFSPPLAIAPESGGDWQPLTTAASKALAQQMARQRGAKNSDELAKDIVAVIAKGMAEQGGQPVNEQTARNIEMLLARATDQLLGNTPLLADPSPRVRSMVALFAAYRAGNAPAFNAELARYETTLATNPPQDLNTTKTGFETFFNHFAPFYYCIFLYLLAFVLTALAWLGWSKPFNRAAFWLCVLTLAVHTFALGARIYISGRPPVTNLYSSAVFIGWGAVILGLGFERLYRMGIGNLVASVAGASTLVVAHKLALDGDTFTVLQAVLDTQFWLATHVVCITLGYATTLVAGLLGIHYILAGVLSPSLTRETAREINRMIYGTICFSIFFSFVGTVLGGLWADDSWGRFWGWDPKENGALIIVLWNALVLHARWCGLARQRGVAVLAVAGNIATAWSWFGVNELGAGLHAYGFTDGVALALVVFVVSQLAIIAIGSLPTHMWMSSR